MNFQLFNDKVWTFPLQCQNVSGVQPWPVTANPTAVSSSPASLGAVVIGQAPTFFLVLTPKVKVSPGLTVTVSNTGMSPVVFTVDIVIDPNMLSVAVDDATADVTTAAQNVPAAPGP